MTTPTLRAATAAALTDAADIRGLSVRQPWAACVVTWARGSRTAPGLSPTPAS
ncbi:hypothetical protein [Streptomyces radiopugnans]|uniref:hypothetical protein n=1 Tax=Streptomyces radiopugnans TaxID=403935 RepID=UPI003F19E900